MVNTAVDAGLGLLLILMWGYIMWQLLGLATSAYGAKYTTALPYLLGGFTLLFVFQVVQLIHDLLSPEGLTNLFFFGLQTIQLVAGILLVLGVYQLFQIEYATTGFFGDERPGGDR